MLGKKDIFSFTEKRKDPAHVDHFHAFNFLLAKIICVIVSRKGRGAGGGGGLTH